MRQAAKITLILLLTPHLLAQQPTGPSAEKSDSSDIEWNLARFELFTRRNRHVKQIIEDNKESIDFSFFEPAKPTRISIHGWNNGPNHNVTRDLRYALLEHGDYNVILVNWVAARNYNLFAVMRSQKPVAMLIARMIDFLVKQYGMRLADLVLIGYSLGAHVAGFAARNVQSGRIPIIIGLDPAHFLVKYSDVETRLNDRDAAYVETIQTTHTWGFGWQKPIGKAAFFPNGGKPQPGCTKDSWRRCSHRRAVEYYIEALRFNNFPAYKCWGTLLLERCERNPSVLMGDPRNKQFADGIYYVDVNPYSPYGTGQMPTSIPEQWNIDYYSQPSNL